MWFPENNPSGYNLITPKLRYPPRGPRNLPGGCGNGCCCCDCHRDRPDGEIPIDTTELPIDEYDFNETDTPLL